ncbi:MAG: hypothetical protein IJ598_05800 [Ruminococcus sp.]|nr:hypothetical protein [Ruminococcus sp.]
MLATPKIAGDFKGVDPLRENKTKRPKPSNKISALTKIKNQVLKKQNKKIKEQKTKGENKKWTKKGKPKNYY